MNEEPAKKFERFRQFAQKVVSVPKTEIDRRESEYRKHRKEVRKARA
jgi:hypothetical protein